MFAILLALNFIFVCINCWLSIYLDIIAIFIISFIPFYTLIEAPLYFGWNKFSFCFTIAVHVCWALIQLGHGVVYGIAIYRLKTDIKYFGMEYGGYLGFPQINDIDTEAAWHDYFDYLSDYFEYDPLSGWKLVDEGKRSQISSQVAFGPGTSISGPRIDRSPKHMSRKPLFEYDPNMNAYGFYPDEYKVKFTIAATVIFILCFILEICIVVVFVRLPRDHTCCPIFCCSCCCQPYGVNQSGSGVDASYPMASAQLGEHNSPPSYEEAAQAPRAPYQVNKPFHAH